jgi:hypothetical protein
MSWIRREPSPARMAKLKAEITRDIRQNLYINDGNDDYLGWRAFQTKLLSNDITPRQRELIIKTSRELVKRDPTSKRALQIPIEAIEASGYSIQTDNKQVEQFFGKFLSKWSCYFSLLYMDRLVNGEICLPVRFNPVNGWPSFGYIDPLAIQSVEYGANTLEPEIVRVKVGLESKDLKVIKFHEDADGYLTYDGDCFYWGNFPMMGMSRGMPELTAELDYVQLFEKAMRSEAARFAELRSFLWFFKFSGKEQEWIDDWMSKTFPDGKPPGPAAMFGGNENFSIEAISPSLQAADAADAAEMIGQHIFSGLGFPTFYFGKGENTNVATAREISIPTSWKLKRHQKTFIEMVKAICSLAYIDAAGAGMIYHKEFLRKLRVDEWDITCGEIYPRDMIGAAQIFGQLMSSVATAQSNGTLPEPVRNEVICVGLRELGIQKTPQELAKQLEVEKKKLEAEKKKNQEKFLANINGKTNGNGHAGDIDDDGEMEKPSYDYLMRQGINPFGRN